MTIKTFPYNHYDLWDSELIRVAYDFSIKANSWIREVISLENQNPVGDLIQEYQPRTPLGHRLWEIRKRIVASGERLLTWDEIEDEVARRRGERG